MNKLAYQILTHIPIFGKLYELKTRPLFSSMGVHDGEYDRILKAIQEYQLKHPKEAITNKVVAQLVRDFNSKP